MVEVAMVGDEGLLGMEAVLGADVATAEAMVQVSDADAEFLPMGVFRRELARRSSLFEAVQRYGQGFVTLLMRSTACVALHPLPARCCRWLLMAHDRVHRDDFRLSHELLAMMLGATRPTVSVVAGSLQRAGLISYVHGLVHILDRAGLEASACECYGAVRTHYDHLGL
jgi:CRP-like cAMP-binding protein